MTLSFAHHDCRPDEVRPSRTEKHLPVSMAIDGGAIASADFNGNLKQYLGIINSSIIDSKEGVQHEGQQIAD
jgi:hypothetical protein